MTNVLSNPRDTLHEQLFPGLETQTRRGDSGDGVHVHVLVGRSYSKADWIISPGNGRRHMLVSMNGKLTCWSWNSSPGRWIIHVAYMPIEFDLIDFEKMKSLEFSNNDVALGVVTISYPSIITPLTLLSAYLLLSRPNRPKSGPTDI